MGGNNVGNLDVIASLKNLEILQVENNNLSNIDIVINFKNLTYLDIDYNSISNIDVIKQLDHLNFLEMAYNNVNDLTPIIECKGMRENSFLMIVGNPLSDVAKNEQIPTLQDRGVYVVF